jgi:hypothetical protein
MGVDFYQRIPGAEMEGPFFFFGKVGLGKVGLALWLRLGWEGKEQFLPRQP